jgi:hypothetical protein
MSGLRPLAYRTALSTALWTPLMGTMTTLRVTGSAAQSRSVRALQEWADRIARGRGKRAAIVALARKLSGILYAIAKLAIPSCERRIIGLSGRNGSHDVSKES